MVGRKRTRRDKRPPRRGAIHGRLVETREPRVVAVPDRAERIAERPANGDVLAQCGRFEKGEARQLVVTPEDARALLRMNVNRRISATRVANIERLMEAGRWADIGDPVRFFRSNQGTTILLDGQHRLTALANLGRTTRLAFFRMHDMQDMEKVDQGRQRELADIIMIDHRLSGYLGRSAPYDAADWDSRTDRRLAQAVTALAFLDTLAADQSSSTWFRLSKEEKLEIGRQRADEAVWAERVLSHRQGIFQSVPIGVTAGLILARRERTDTDPDGEIMARDFAVPVMSGVLLGEDSPALFLRGKLTDPNRNREARGKAPTGNSFGEHLYWVGMVLACVDRHFAGRDATRLARVDRERIVRRVRKATEPSVDGVTVRVTEGSG